METVSIENVVVFHRKIIEKTGGSMGIRDEKLLDSALNRGFSTFDREYLYKSDVEKNICYYPFANIKSCLC